MKLIATSALAGLALSSTVPKEFNALTHLNFNEWMAHHDIQFDPSEMADRLQHWANTKKFVREHNEKFMNGEVEFHVSMNKFAAMPNEEFVEKYLLESWEVGTYQEGQEEPDMLTQQYSCPTKYTSTSHSSSYDGKAKGYVTSVKDQGSCGSCWTFGAGAAVEAAFCKAGTKRCSSWNGASTQQLLDCASNNKNLEPNNNNGCSGGWQSNAMRYYWIEGHGVNEWDKYPYTGSVARSCGYSSRNSIGNVKSCGRLGTAKNEDMMCSMVEAKGAATIAIDASGLAFQTYNGGVYSSSSCSTTRVNHAVTATGFGTTSGTKTLTIKNSWGTSWGDKGFVYFKRDGKNTCGAFGQGQYAIL